MASDLRGFKVSLEDERNHLARTMAALGSAIDELKGTHPDVDEAFKAVERDVEDLGSAIENFETAADEQVELLTAELEEAKAAEAG